MSLPGTFSGTCCRSGVPYRSIADDWDLPPPVKPDSRARLPLVLAAVASLALGFFGFAAAKYGLERDPRTAAPVLTPQQADPGIFYGRDGKVYVDTSWSYLHVNDPSGKQIGHARVLVAMGGRDQVRLP